MKKSDLVEKVVEQELAMFLSVPADGEYDCRKHPDRFRSHRRAQFAIWSRDTVDSYLQDLLRAKAEGVNLMTVKYARMSNLKSRTKDNPVIEEILGIQYRWQREIIEKYPKLMGGARPLSSAEDSSFQTSFETYMGSELETYSDKTLLLLYRDLTDLRRRGINGSEQIYEFLVKEMGYKSIEDAENSKKHGNV